MKRSRIIEIIREEIQNVLREQDLNEMATFYKIKGDKSAAKKAIAAEKEKYREGTTLYNTLDTLEKKGEIDYKKLSQETGKDVATYNNPKSRGVLEKELADYIEAETSKRGRKADPNKPKSAKKTTSKKGRPAGKTSGMDADDKAAVKAGETDSVAKSASSTPEEKKEKFNLGLKFIKKYKDDKPKVDAYLKKAKEEYKLTKSMLDDLKRAAGRDVG